MYANEFVPLTYDTLKAELHQKLFIQELLALLLSHLVLYYRVFHIEETRESGKVQGRIAGAVSINLGVKGITDSSGFASFVFSDDGVFFRSIC